MTQYKQKFSFDFLLRHNIDTRSEDVYVKILVYPLVLPLAWLVLNFTRISANQITIFGLVSGISGGGLALATNNLGWLVIGFFLFYICDFLDGRVALANGGGTYLGTILDLMTDRTVLLISVFSLAFYHYLHNETCHMLFVFTYYVIYEYIDMTAFVSLKAKVRFNRQPNVSARPPFTHNTFRNNINNLSVWFPTRLSSPILGILTFLITSSFYYAYCLAIISASFDYLRIIKPYLISPLHNSRVS